VSDNSASSAGGIQPKTRQGGGPPLALSAGLHGISSSAGRAGVYEAVAGRHALVSDWLRPCEPVRDMGDETAPTTGGPPTETDEWNEAVEPVDSCVVCSGCDMSDVELRRAVVDALGAARLVVSRMRGDVGRVHGPAAAGPGPRPGLLRGVTSQSDSVDHAPPSGSAVPTMAESGASTTGSTDQAASASRPRPTVVVRCAPMSVREREGVGCATAVRADVNADGPAAANDDRREPDAVGRSTDGGLGGAVDGGEWSSIRLGGRGEPDETDEPDDEAASSIACELAMGGNE